MDNYTLEPLPQPDARKQRITRILLIIWLVLGISVGLLLCWIVSNAFRPPPQVPVYVGDLDQFPPNSINKKFIDGPFFDETANKDQDTLPLAVVRDANGNFTVFYARSTNPAEAILVPRQCVVEWDDSLQHFLELCGGSTWDRNGKYISGPAPRDLDRFPPHVTDGKLYIDLTLQRGAAHP